jgi:hypothetical protein
MPNPVQYSLRPKLITHNMKVSCELYQIRLYWTHLTTRGHRFSKPDCAICVQRAKTVWRGIGIMCPSGATSAPVNGCFSHRSLYISNHVYCRCHLTATWRSTNHTEEPEVIPGFEWSSCCSILSFLCNMV